MHLRKVVSWATFVVGVLVAWQATAQPRTKPAQGLRQNTPTVHALVGAKIVVSPEKTIDRGNMIVREGVITAVGAEAEVPPDAVIHPLAGKTIYAGLIDALTELSDDVTIPPRAGPGYWNENVTPEFRVADVYATSKRTNDKLRRQGITARLVAPSRGVIKGTSALVTTADVEPELSVLDDGVALHMKLTTSRRSIGDYPRSPMGALALARQAFCDARWYSEVWPIYDEHSLLPRPEVNTSLDAMRGILDGKGPVVIDAADTLYFFRADRFAREFKLRAIVRGSGEEYQRLDAVRDTGLPIIVPVNFPKAPNVNNPEMALSIALDKLMHWDIAPENPGRLDNAGVTIALTSYGLKDSSTFLSAVAMAVEHGLKRESALRALTVTPASLLGIDDRLGTIEKGKLAHLVVTDGPLFARKTKIVETWVDGHRYDVAATPRDDVRGTWELRIAADDGSSETLKLELSGESRKLSGTLQRGDRSAKLTSASLEGAQLAASLPGKSLGWKGVLQLTATVLDSSAPQTPDRGPEASSDELSLLGALLWSDGKQSSITGRRASAPKDAEKSDSPAPAEGKEGKPREKPVVAGPEDQPPDDPDMDRESKKSDDSESKSATEPKKSSPKRPTHALYPVNYPLGEFGLERAPEQPKAIVFRGATVWTCDSHGKRETADVLVESGKISAVDANLDVPKGAVSIDARGKHITPGIIDCHSHIATDGGVNEGSQAITAEVRIGDFIDPYDINIYRQLAGGVTAANILHGSANPIGGQNQVIKFRWGAGPEEAKLAQAPPGIKFALGENVKQSNSFFASRDRYPQSRMGVEQLLRDAFRAAQEYRDARRRWDEQRKANKISELPPRCDLELEALVEVLEGKRLIHCHSYRQDEILATMRVCEEFNVRIATFQHILEGYKVADQMARHGVGGSSFSDWWAYKFEVFDAIPYNGALLRSAGVLVSFNSDDAEMARRLNLEAAKAVKYGGVPEVEALKFVTFNAAKQLGIDRWVGSIEPGKDADLVLWNGSPLSTYARCEQTWIDGRKYFDRSDDAKRRSEVVTRRAALVQRILASGEPFAGPDDDKKDEWPREDEVCHDHDGHVHGGEY
ncbi:MAG TPA: amidohydrolase family protein [Pirellulales bacterium]|jgi:N-acetylglucosamine-6-phosphate deacetylase|nr:amidohydrolase family protein [Pirellulales bacterium]